MNEEIIISTKISLVVSTLIIAFMLYLVGKTKSKDRLYKHIYTLFVILEVYAATMFWQLQFSDSLNIPPIYFEYLAALAIQFMPIAILNIALVYRNRKVDLKKTWWTWIIPTIMLFVIWTNSLHHLMYESYSVVFSDNVKGPLYDLNSIYSYTLTLIAVVILATDSFRKSGFFSKQSVAIIFGFSIPMIFNILGVFNVIETNVYLTPITYTSTAVCFAVSIIKYRALNITPIALSTITNTMSDAYVIVSNDGTMGEKNEAFDRFFGHITSVNKERNLFKLLAQVSDVDLDYLKDHIKEAYKTGHTVTREYCIKKPEYTKYFEVDVKSIHGKYTKEKIATLFLLKDITQHKQDIEIIKDKQEVIVKQGQLVSIGELAGGVAHDINTPISAIKTGLTLMEEMYTVRNDQERELLLRMNNCTDKIIKIVNSMRNQIRNLGSEEKVDFKISEILSDVKIIAFNELQKNKCDLEINIVDDLSVHGMPTKLSQVLTNLIINAMQAYDGKGGKIVVNLSKAPSKKLLIEIKDFAGGMPEHIKKSVFKNILTTKGTSGTGLGLYLAYSVIRGEFDGEISFDSEEGKGTTFFIELDRI